MLLHHVAVGETRHVITDGARFANAVATLGCHPSEITWRAGIDNVFDRRFWREAPTTYWGGTYLFPAQPRTFRVSLQAGF